MQTRARSTFPRIFAAVLFLVLWTAPSLRASFIVPGLFAAVDNGVVEVGTGTVITGYSLAGLAFDANGSFYAAEPSSGNVYTFTPSGGVSVFTSGLISPFGVALDSAGNVWVSQSDINQVVQIAPGGAQTPYFTGASPTYVAVDSLGDVFVSDYFSSDIYEIDSSGIPIPFAFGIVSPAGLAFDGAGFLYAASGDGNIYKYDTGGNATTFATGLASPSGLAFDSGGILYAATAAGDIYGFTPGGTASLYTSGLTAPAGLAYAAAVPEPGVCWLTVAGLAVLAWKRRRRLS